MYGSRVHFEPPLSEIISTLFNPCISIHHLYPLLIFYFIRGDVLYFRVYPKASKFNLSL